MKQVCSLCQQPSLPGLAVGHGKCAYHFTAGVWGTAWADKMADRPGAQDGRFPMVKPQPK